MLGVSTLIDFLLVRGMQRFAEQKQRFAVIALLVNLGALGFFKYHDFFIDDLARVAGLLGIQHEIFLTRILFPAGLSFYTLKKLGYLIDVMRGTLQPTHSLTDFALYVSFLPQITAGPIDRPQTLEEMQNVPLLFHLFFSSPLLFPWGSQVAVLRAIRIDREGISSPFLITMT